MDFYNKYYRIYFGVLYPFLIKDNENQQRFDEYGMEYITTPLMITGYVVLFYFLFCSIEITSQFQQL